MHKQASEQPDTHLNLVKYIKNLNRINLSTSIAFYLYFFQSSKASPYVKIFKNSFLPLKNIIIKLAKSQVYI